MDVGRAGLAGTAVLADAAVDAQYRCHCLALLATGDPRSDDVPWCGDLPCQSRIHDADRLPVHPQAEGYGITAPDGRRSRGGNFPWRLRRRNRRCGRTRQRRPPGAVNRPDQLDNVRIEHGATAPPYPPDAAGVDRSGQFVLSRDLPQPVCRHSP
jgi:hypothetical protein